MPQENNCERLVAIGASAGGVQPLLDLLQSLPTDLEAAICIVTHIASHTPNRLHELLALKSKLPVAPAEDGEPLCNGRVYLAVSDRHLMVTERTIRLTRGPKESRARPSIDVLFRSAAMSFGPRAVGVILSGMLDDGTAGLWAIKDQQGTALVQDPAQAQYASMPESALEHVEVDYTGPARALASEIVRRCQEPVARSNAPTAFQRHELENRIAGEGNALQGGIMDLGKVSKYTCPDCHGVLVQIEEGSILRFRCHTGHAFSIKTLLVEVGDAIDNGLWDTIRALEERVLLLRQMSDLARKEESSDAADRSIRQAEHIEENINALRKMVIDPDIFGHSSSGADRAGDAASGNRTASLARRAHPVRRNRHAGCSCSPQRGAEALSKRAEGSRIEARRDQSVPASAPR
jgi:two-component system chemotaxis response regulator CheB